jgi:penicillin-insensitive murein endopeptidase
METLDYMVPTLKDKKQSQALDRLGMWHYLLEFTPDGQSKLNKRITLDYESMTRHILDLDDAAQKNGLRIRMIIFNIELKREFFNSPSGKKVKQRGFYFAQSLDSFINKVHDDHRHVDFAPDV